MGFLNSLCSLTTDNSHILIIGTYRSGKTTTIRDILTTLDSDTLHNKVYAYEYEFEARYMDLIPVSRNIPRPVEYSFGSIIEDVVIMINGDRKDDHRLPIVVMDDCIYNLAFCYQRSLKLLADNSKCIISICYPFDLRPAIMIRYVCILPNELQCIRDKIYNTYVVNIMEYKEFNWAIEYIEKIEGLIVIDNIDKKFWIYDKNAYKKQRWNKSLLSF